MDSPDLQIWETADGRGGKNSYFILAARISKEAPLNPEGASAAAGLRGGGEGREGGEEELMSR